MNRKGKAVLYSYLLGAVLLLILWEAVALLMQRPIVPTPELVFAKMAHVFASSIAVHAAWSLWRIAAGLALAVLAGFPLGVVMGYFPKADRYLAPLVYLTYPIPKIALLPILMVLAGVGDLSKIVMIFLIIVFQVVIAVRDGILLKHIILCIPWGPLSGKFCGMSFFRRLCRILSRLCA